MKIVLVNLPWKKGGNWGVRAGSRWPHIKTVQEESYLPFPFFLAYAAALLKRESFQVRLIDAIADKLSVPAFHTIVEQEKPDLLVVETSTPSLINDLEVLRGLSGDISIALCGPDANIREAGFLKKNVFIDYVFAGEYELTLLELARALCENKPLQDITGLIYRDREGIRTNPGRSMIADLDTLPWPLREGLPMGKYNDTPGGIPSPSAQMWASRGCPYQCLFCLWPQLMYQKGRYRVRSVRDVVDEMEHLVTRGGVKSIYFDDDTFNIGKLRMLEFAREIKARKLDIPWAVMARADLMDEQVLVSLREAGLCAVKYGVESAEQSLVDNINKNMQLERVERIIKFTNSLGIKTHLTFTFGLPGETWESIKKTIEFAVRMDPDSVQFSITTAFPGTQYFRNLEEKGYILSHDLADYDGNSKGVLRTDSLGPRDLEKAKRIADKAFRMHVLRTRHNRMQLRDYIGKAWKKFVNSRRVFFSQLALLIDSKLSFTITNLAKTGDLLKSKGVGQTYIRIKHNYKAILGVCNGSYAFKGPQCVQIDLTSKCNNNCIGCWCNSPLLGDKVYKGIRKYQTLPTELVKGFIDDLAGMGTREIYFSGGGEPFMHSNILDILEYARLRELDCTVHTNFTLVNEKVVRRLIDLGVSNLTVSVWAGSPETYVATHPNKNEPDYHRIHDMLCMLNSLKKNSKPYVKIYNVILNVNYGELERMVEFARGTGSDAVEFTVIDTIPDATDKLLLSGKERDAALEQCGKIRARDNGVQVVNLEHFMRRLSDLGSDCAQYDSSIIETMPCYIGWLFARIMPDGDVNSCLKSHRIPVGNLYESSFRQIWNSGRQRHFRRMTLQAKKSDPFFALIGNDPDCKIGCYKGCDDIGRNLHMHNLISSLSPFERGLLKAVSKIKKI